MQSHSGSVLVADGHELFGSALKSLLVQEFNFLAAYLALSFKGAVTMLHADPRITLATLDMSMPDMAGSESIILLRDSFPSLRILIVSAMARRDDILKYLGWGVHGFISKTQTVPEIIEAMKVVLGGNIFVPRTLSDLRPNDAPERIGTTPLRSGRAELRPFEGIAVPLADPLASPPAVHLSARQKAVFALIVEGRSNKEIARALGLAEGTVKVHINGLFRALNVHNRAAAVATLVSSRAASAPGAPFGRADGTRL
jgi:DNA-binding NarL/FixJ family response regulator